MAKIELPRFLIARAFKGHTAYYWRPPKKTMQRHDLLPRRLTNDLGTAIQEAEAFNRQLDAIRDGQLAALPERIKGTLPWLYIQFQGSTKYRYIAESTQQYYDENFKIIRQWSEKAGHPHASGLTRLQCLKFYEFLCAPDPATEEYKMTRSVNVMKTLRRVLKHGVDIAIMSTNPATRMELVTPSPRDQIWTDDQVQRFIAAAIKAGRWSMALAVRLAADLGPRRGDVIRLPPTSYSDGMFTFRPRKNRRIREGTLGKWVQVRALPELRAMMARVVRTEGNTVATAIVVSERTGMPYTEDAFTREFREIADTVTGLTFGNTPLLFMDLRRTAVINLARASCTVPEIAAITAHSKETIYEILETYLPTDSVVAENAVAKLEAYRKRETKADQS